MNITPASSAVLRNPSDIPGLVSFWDFQEAAGQDRVARAGKPYRLREVSGPVERVEDGVFGPYAARFTRESEGSLAVPRAECPDLDRHGPDAQVSIVAWIKREPTPPDEQWRCQAVAGMWNEHGLRQYCLFLNLRIHESAEQVGSHISRVGGATPGFKYCMDAAIGASPVPFGVWQCVAITYDGTDARAYLNGRLDERGDRNPYRYEGGIFDGGPGGADFTVGAVARPQWVDEQFVAHGSVVSNRFLGLLGGLAVYDRALSDTELAAVFLASLPFS
ncbi:MAG: LamG domain-containing protein [Cytophagales bacterium]|nr:LamG domain-containing protein [Armatimonadota bacterium]